MRNRESKNVAMVAYTYYKSDPRVRKEAEALTGAGFNVDFLSLGREDELGFEEVNGVGVFRLNCRHFKGKSNFKHLLSYINFFVRVCIKITFLHFKKKYRLIHINNMPDLLVFTSLIPKILGAKILLDIHDVMSEVYAGKNVTGHNILLNKALIFQERLSAKFADYVIVVDEYRRDAVSKHGILLDKIIIISNFPDSNLFKPLSGKIKKKRDFTLVFHGTVSRIYGLDTVIKGIGRAYNRIPNLKFKLIGEGDYEKEVLILIRKLNLESVIDFKNYMIPHERIPQEIGDADVGIVSCPRITAIYQNKFMEYISMGIPPLVEYNEEVYKFYKDYNLEFYEKNNPESLARKLYYLYKDKERYNELKDTSVRLGRKFRWESEKLKYIDLVKSLVLDCNR